MRIEPWKKRYRQMKIRNLELQAKYYKLKAQMMKEIEVTSNTVSRKRYLEVLAKLRRCQSRLEKTRQLG